MTLKTSILKNKTVNLFTLTLLVAVSSVMIFGPSKAFADPCDPSKPPLATSVYGVPTWYKYLEGTKDPVTLKCVPFGDTDFDEGKLKSALPAIGLAAIEILLRLVVITAIIWMIYGGFQYMTSQGEPNATAKAKDTVLNALIGVVIGLTAGTLVAFIGTKLF